MSDPGPQVVQILGDELGACPDKDRVLAVPYLEHTWDFGLAAQDGLVIRGRGDDFCWWFLEAFAPENLDVARRAHDAIGDFCFDLHRLGDTGGSVDWNFVFHLRRRVLRAMFPTAYQVATGATEGPPGKASEMIKKFTTAEQWRKNS